jgi:hypothetical protein
MRTPRADHNDDATEAGATDDSDVDGGVTGRLRRAWSALWKGRGTATTTTVLSSAPGMDTAASTTTPSPTAGDLARVLAARPSDEELNGVLSTISAASPALRSALAKRLAHTLEQHEPDSGAFDAWARVAPMLIDELVECCTLESAWRWQDLHTAGALVAALVVARMHGPVGMLGATRLRALALAPTPEHRAIAVAAIRRDPLTVRRDLPTMVELAEVAAADVRGALCAVLVDDSALSPPAAIDFLLDATSPDVQDAGFLRLRHRRRTQRVDVDVLASRLATHPARRVRRAAGCAALDDGAAVTTATLVSLLRCLVFDPASDDDDLDVARRLVLALRERAVTSHADAAQARRAFDDVVAVEAPGLVELCARATAALDATRAQAPASSPEQP